jgi:hypothetical protein
MTVLIDLGMGKPLKIIYKGLYRALTDVLHAYSCPLLPEAKF